MTLEKIYVMDRVITRLRTSTARPNMTDEQLAEQTATCTNHS